MRQSNKEAFRELWEAYTEVLTKTSVWLLFLLPAFFIGLITGYIIGRP